MGNNAVNKVLPAIDMLLVLVVILFSTAGLLRSLQGMPSESTDPKQAVVEEKKKELQALKEQLNALQQSQDSVEDLEQSRDIVKQQKDRVDQAEEQFHKVIEQVSNISLQCQLQQMKETLNRLQNKKQQLEQALNDLEAGEVAYQRLKKDLEDIQTEIFKLQAEIDKKGGSAWPGGSGYNGPFVLLECDAQGVIVYPDEERLPIDAPKEKIEGLKESVREKGAVLLLVRPSGFKKSFDHYKPILTTLVGEERGKGKTVVFTYWPVDENASIEKYIPKGD